MDKREAKDSKINAKKSFLPQVIDLRDKLYGHEKETGKRSKKWTYHKFPISERSVWISKLHSWRSSILLLGETPSKSKTRKAAQKETIAMAGRRSSQRKEAMATVWKP